jgi:hypothetical protein
MIFLVSAVNSIFDTDSTPIITFISFAVFYAVSDMPLRPSYVVLVINYYSIIAASLQFFFIRGIIWLIGGAVSMKRVQVERHESRIQLLEPNIFNKIFKEYLLQPEIEKKESKEESESKDNEQKEPHLRIKNLNANWNSNVCLTFWSIFYLLGRCEVKI